MSIVYAPLPLPPSALWAATLTWLGAPGGGGRDRPRVLLVEDDFAIAQMYRVQLERDGFEVAIADDGDSALRAIRADRPDLVLLDIRLPGMDGFEILRQMAADRTVSSTPVVVLSNYGDPRDGADRPAAGSGRVCDQEPHHAPMGFGERSQVDGAAPRRRLTCARGEGDGGWGARAGECEQPVEGEQMRGEGAERVLVLTACQSRNLANSVMATPYLRPQIGASPRPSMAAPGLK